MPFFAKSLRSLAARPLLPIVAVATLTLGLGVNAAIFSLTREILLRPLPYRDVDRLVQVFETSRTAGAGPGGTTPFNYVAWRARVTSFEQTATFRRVGVNVGAGRDVFQVESFRVSPTFFPMLGVEPALGRGFRDEDARAGHDDVVLLTDGFWRRRFDGDPAVVGRWIDVDGAPCIVAGILPASFRLFRVLNREIEVFRPFVLDPTDRERSMIVWAKLRPGVPVERARADMAAVYATLPLPNPVWSSADVQLFSTRFANQSRPILLALQAAVALVLLIACANVANLLLAVSAERRRELAIRRALGAGPWRIVRDFAGETAVLAAAGGSCAILFATWVVGVLNATVSFQDINRLQAFQVDRWVVAFTIGLTFIVAMVVALLPARGAGEADVIDALKDMTHGVTTGVGNRQLRYALIVGELALSIVLTATALALARSVLTLHSFERGLTKERVMTAQVTLNGPRYDDTGRLIRTAERMVDRLGASAGVASATLVNYAPLALIRTGVPLSIEGHPPVAPDQPWVVRYWVAEPNYFRTAGIPILAGRDFNAADDASRAGVAIVGETFARRFWNTVDVVGRRVKTEFPQSAAFWIPRARRDWLTIVGVVGDVREDGVPDATSSLQLYLPYAQNPTIVLTLMARATGSAESVAAAIRDAVRTVDPQAPVSYEQSLSEIMDETFARPREMAWLVGAFAALALILSVVGVYGVMAYLTTVRTREIGIRIALGATPVRIVWLVVGHALTLTAAGVAIGVVLAPMALRTASGLLFGVGPFDPTTLVAVSALLAVVSIGASIIPAVRAARMAAVSFR